MPPGTKRMGPVIPLKECIITAQYSELLHLPSTGALTREGQLRDSQIFIYPLENIYVYRNNSRQIFKTALVQNEH
jgi:hypothetical protein